MKLYIVCQVNKNDEDLVMYLWQREQGTSLPKSTNIFHSCELNAYATS